MSRSRICGRAREVGNTESVEGGSGVCARMAEGRGDVIGGGKAAARGRGGGESGGIGWRV